MLHKTSDVKIYGICYIMKSSNKNYSRLFLHDNLGTFLYSFALQNHLKLIKEKKRLLTRYKSDNINCY